MMNRREFLHSAGYFSTGTIAALATNSWVAEALSAAPPTANHRLIVVLLRGAVDGLNVVVPYQDMNYYKARPTIAIAKPGEPAGAIDLDGRFGLNPALSSLMPLWKQGSLAFVHASGSPDGSRSHFDAQDYLETGTPGVKTTADGWMNRLLVTLSNHSPVQALNLGNTTPRILAGPMAVASLAPGKRSVTPLAIDRPEVGNAFDRLYQGSDPLSRTYQEGRAARAEILASLQTEMDQADRGAPGTQGFVNDAKRLAQLMKNNANIQLGFVALGGWDTHINQGNGKGLLSARLKPLGDGLAALVQGLGPLYRDTTILVMSEFGRTVRENGNRGTDHGHGNVMWVMGGGIKGGRIQGQWPGLADGQLYQGRDLAVTTDFRDVIQSILMTRLKVDRDQLARIFPGYQSTVKIDI
jgi:uncharacterized protein (DUF1501 family)